MDVNSNGSFEYLFYKEDILALIWHISRPFNWEHTVYSKHVHAHEKTVTLMNTEEHAEVWIPLGDICVTVDSYASKC